MRFLKKYLPNHHSIKSHSHLRWISHWLTNPQLWNFNRRSVAVGTAVGLFAAVLPVPIQMLIAILLAIFMRGNIPIAVMMTWVTNPFTMLPMVYFIYFIGSLLTGEHASPQHFQEFSIDLEHLPELWQHVVAWFTSLGKNFFVGLPIVAVGLAILGYIAVNLIWYIYLHVKIYYRKKKYKQK